MERALVLVHGYMDSGSTLWWNRIEKYLNKTGFCVKTVDLGNIGTTTESPVKYAHEIEDCVENAISMCSGCEEVTIVAHSMGGIASRWYIEEMDGNEKIDSLVTLGTPHRGTLAAYLGIFSKGGKQLTPSSEIIKRLNGKGIKQDVEYHIISGERDNMVVPSENAQLPNYGEEDNIHNHKIDCGHVKMVLSLDKFKKGLSKAGIL